ncbi:baseplate protein [Microcystis phage vB_MweS-yong2]|nr:baseplate protein [Microcystis phage vB_MweS-yong2]
MAWRTPTLQEVVTDAVRGLNAAMPGADAALARNNLNPVAKILAGGLHAVHNFAAWAADQRFVLTCDAEQLDRHGAEMKPAVPRKQASAASGLVTMTTAVAATLATGAILTRSDGTAYRVDVGASLAGAGSADVMVTATAPGGASNCAADTAMTAASGLTGAATTFAVAAQGVGGGADVEDDEAYRTRLLLAKAYPEHGGAPPDWLRYALSCAGVTRAFIDPLGAGRGTVVVYPLFDLTRPNGIGLESDRIAVETRLREIGPGAGWGFVKLPVARVVPVTIHGLAPDTPDVRSAIAAEIAAAFARQSRVAGLSQSHVSMPFLATPAVMARSWIWQAVANAAGEERHAVASPAADVVLLPGEIAVPGALSFTP